MSCQSDIYNYLLEIGILYSREESCAFPQLLPYEPQNKDYYLFQLNYNYGQQRCYKTIQRYKDGFKEIKAFRYKDEIAAFGMVNQESIIIQFLPALSRCQWIYSFQNQPVEIDGFKIHSGIYTYFEQLLQPILKFIDKHDNGKRKVIYTGYSLGGPMSLLLSMNIVPDQVFIWGSPLFIDSNGVEWIEENVPYRGWINQSDPVPFFGEGLYQPIWKGTEVFDINYKNPHLNHLYGYADYLRSTRS